MTADLLFVYGSLVSQASAASTLGYRPATQDGPVPATLTGYRREWNVGSNHESHPERLLIAADGRPFTGTLAVLGLTEDGDAECTGALYRLSRRDLELLAVRERNYTLIEVDLARPAVGIHPGATSESRTSPTVLTYAPRPESLTRLAAAREAGSAVVQRAYARRVERAFEALGPGQLAAFRRTTTPHGLPEQLVQTRSRVGSSS